jgi:hypothetical protein
LERVWRRAMTQKHAEIKGLDQEKENKKQK